MAVFVAGCSYYSDSCSYDIVIRGLGNCTGSGNSEILIPVPTYEGIALYNDSQINATIAYNDGTGVWKPEIVQTEYGTMLSLKTGETNLSDVDFRISEPVAGDTKKIGDSIKSLPFSPRVSDQPGNYTLWYLHGKDNTVNYTSYVYVSDGIRSINAGQSITFQITMSFNEGSKKGYLIGVYNYWIYESIPANISGWIPVKVQLESITYNPR